MFKFRDDWGSEVAFTAPYVVIEGVYVVPAGSSLATADDVNRPGVRVGTKEGSAYDLHLSRKLAHASVVRGAEGVDVFAAQGLDVGAGIRQPATEWVAQHPGHRVLEPAFMQIRQAVGTTRSRSDQTVTWLTELVEELKSTGFVAESLDRSGQDAALAAPPS